MTAGAGTEVGLCVDLVDEVGVGDVIETQSGRRYLVVARRRQERGVHVGRQHLRCVVLGDHDQPTPDPVVHKIRWYRRGRGRR